MRYLGGLRRGMPAAGSTRRIPPGAAQTAAGHYNGLVRTLRISALLPVLCTATLTGAEARLWRLPQVIAQAAVSAEASGGSLEPAERTFVLGALEASRTQAELARLAVSQATRHDLREFAQDLAATYRDLNVSLENLARRKGLSPAPQPVSYSSVYQELATRPANQFDAGYLREVVAANERTLRLIEAAVRVARDEDVRALAGSALPVIREHVNRGTELEKNG